MNIENLSNDQLTRLHDIRDCVDEILRDIMTDPEVLELLRVRLCFDPSEMDGCEVVFEQDPEDTSGHGVVAHLFPRLDLPTGSDCESEFATSFRP